MYNEEDFISNLFKENEHLLEERPSRNAWAKLEDKLDQDKVRGTRRIYRYISTAAAVIAIVAMISAIALFKNGNDLVADNSTQTIAKNDQQGELSVTDKTSDWRKEYGPEILEEEVELEEESTVVTKEEIEKPVLDKKKSDRPIIADNSIPTKKPKQLTPPKASKPNEKTRIKPVPTVVPQESATYAEETQPGNASGGVVADKEIVKTEEAEADVIPEAAWNLSDDAAYAEAKKERTNSSYDAEKTRKASKAKSKTNSNTVDDYSTKKKDNKKTTIADFQWLTGAWSNNTTNGISYEQWTKSSKKSLVANGYLIQNGDTTFVEKMELKEIRGKVYYYSNFGTDNSLTKFELISYKNGRAIFENKKSKSPTKVVITKDNNNSFTITFQEAITPKLQYRNNIENARASRRMSRAFKK